MHFLMMQLLHSHVMVDSPGDPGDAPPAKSPLVDDDLLFNATSLATVRLPKSNPLPVEEITT